MGIRMTEEKGVDDVRELELYALRRDAFGKCRKPYGAKFQKTLAGLIAERPYRGFQAETKQRGRSRRFGFLDDQRYNVNRWAGNPTK